MSRVLHCSTHGESRTAYICKHLLATLHDEEPRGAVWVRDEDGCINARCGDCANRLETAGGEWVGEALPQLDIKIICEGCFRRIAVIDDFAELD
jgi:hypothetical protein